MSDKPVYSAAAAMDPAASIATANKMLSNTYWLLGLTLAFSALTAVALLMPACQCAGGKDVPVRCSVRTHRLLKRLARRH